MSKKRITVFLAADDRYLPYLGVTVKSIADHTRGDFEYDVKILSTQIPGERLQLLFDMPLNNVTVSVVDLDRRIGGIREELKRRLRDYYSESIYYRLFIPSMFPELDRAVYIDCDVVLCEDISRLYFTELGDALLGAVSDESIPDVPAFCDYVRDWVGVPPEEYFNSGVLVMNLKAMREFHIEEKFLYLLGEYNFDTVAPDQDYLNRLCYGRVCYLDKGWNKQPKGNGEPLSGQFLIHYNMFNKPWHYRGVEYEEAFWRVAATTPFYEEIYRELLRYNDELKKIDCECAVRLIQNAARLSQRQGGFSQVITEEFHESFSCVGVNS